MKIIYYEDWRTVFYCQDKNASTTLKEILDEAASNPPFIYWDESTLNPSEPGRLKNLRRKPRDFEFTIVRNTWDRLSSLYHMLRKQPEKEWRAKPKGRLNPWFWRFEEDILPCFAQEAPFDAFIEVICAQEDAVMDSHWQPQCTHLPLESERFFVGRFDRLQKDFEVIASHMGIPPIVLPVSSNQTRNDRDSYVNDYSDASRTLVGERYAKEIELFGFEFDA